VFKSFIAFTLAVWLGKLSYNVSHIYEVAAFENRCFILALTFFDTQSFFFALNPPFHKYAVGG
jgi:hypothetical protein